MYKAIHGIETIGKTYEKWFSFAYAVLKRITMNVMVYLCVLFDFVGFNIF